MPRHGGYLRRKLDAEVQPGVTKFCPRCERVRPIEDYQKNASNPDGLQTYCRDCQNAVSRQSKQATKEYQKARLQHGL